MIRKTKKFIKALKERFIKKVYVRDIYFEKSTLILELELINFIKIRDIECILDKNDDTMYSLDYIKDNNILKIHIPHNNIIETINQSKINLYINKQSMWLRKSEDLLIDQLGFLIDQKKYALHISKKTIKITPLFQEYKFHSSTVEVEKVAVDFNRLQFTLDQVRPFITGKNNIKILALNNRKDRILDTNMNVEKNAIILRNFDILSSGEWLLYADVDYNLYPLELIEKSELSFDTQNHHVIIENHDNQIALNLNPHIIRVNGINVDNQMSHVVLKLHVDPLTKFNKNIKLIVEDIRYHEELIYDMETNNEVLKANIPLIDLVERTSTKRFFILGYDEKNKIQKKYQLDLTEQLRINSSKKIKEVINSQETTFEFYVRKDLSLGLKVKLPKIKRMITDIKNFRLSGFVRGMSKFENCTPYLILQDRNTEDQLEFKIDKSFKLDLNQPSLLTLKGKEKSILDFYIAVKDKYGNYIRKAKIKYKHSNYKKDNYYDELQLRDTNGDIHYFIATTTPYDNLKLETFKVPNKILNNHTGKNKDEKVWLLGERYDTAQDNGFVLYKWLRQHTDIQAYYVIESASEDYEKIKDDPHVLPFGSEKHYEIAIKAKVLLGTHDLENLLPYKAAPGFFHYEDTIKVFLQHGVLGRKSVEYHKKYYDSPFDIFIVSSYPEKYDIVVQQFGYEENEVKVTGLARFDNLQRDEKGKDILLMPTWRDWINTDEQFLESEYYHNYVRFLKNPELHELLEEYNVQLNFYPHYRAQEFFKKEIENTANKIKFITLGKKSVQQLLKEHALLITDFSSVSFDFTLMNKPVIFYHFDEKRFFRNGILRPIEETFLGRIAKNEHELMEYLKDRLEHDFDNYQIDTSGIIRYKDRKNCERIYHEVINYLQQENRRNLDGNEL